MRKIRKPIRWFLSLALVLGLFTIVDVNQSLQADPNIPVYSFNGQDVPFQQASIKRFFWGSLLSVTQKKTNEEALSFTTDQILNTLEVSESTVVTVTTPDQKTVTFIGSQTLAFEDNGEVLVALDELDDNGSRYHYEFKVDVQTSPLIHFSTLSPSQGDVLIIEISNLRLNSTLSVTSDFVPSAFLQTSHEGRFYLPMEYRKEAKSYPLALTLNGVTTNFTLNLQPYDFHKDYFNIDPSLIKATSGNPTAVNQFKAVIYPLYDTAAPIEYWQGNFILPVGDVRISSGFGDMRFINGSTNPTRHGGIDYAVDCGTPVYASNAGLVEAATLLILTGNTLVIDHGLGLKTLYEHMEDLSVEIGDVVEKGQLIGHVGSTGLSTGCHLHFQAMVKGQTINPMSLMSWITEN